MIASVGPPVMKPITALLLMWWDCTWNWPLDLNLEMVFEMMLLVLHHFPASAFSKVWWLFDVGGLQLASSWAQTWSRRWCFSEMPSWPPGSDPISGFCGGAGCCSCCHQRLRGSTEHAHWPFGTQPTHWDELYRGCARFFWACAPKPQWDELYVQKLQQRLSEAPLSMRHWNPSPTEDKMNCTFNPMEDEFNVEHWKLQWV